MAFTKLNNLKMLAQGVRGEAYAPQGGIADDIWGQENISRARFDESVERIANRGLPGTGLGFKTSKYGSPNSTWDGFHGLMMGLRDGVQAQGKKLVTSMSGSRQRPWGYDTRRDGDQVDPLTGRTLTEDTYAGRPDLQIPIYQLRRQFGLK